MTEIKLRPDCELATALEGFALAWGKVGRDHTGVLDLAAVDMAVKETSKARAHLLEVIRGHVEAGVDNDSGKARGWSPKWSPSLWPGKRREIANEIMGVMSDD